MEIFTHSIFGLITQSDLVTKLILLFLLAMSITCWALFFYKVILLNIKKRQLHHVAALVKKSSSIDEIRSLAASHASTFPGYCIIKILVLLKVLLETKESRTTLTDRDALLLQQGTDQIVENMLADEESYLSLFSSCAAVSPLLGLFGTVWGLIHAFLRISEKQQADITTVAPGIAEALITTLAGLLVAIPALLMFNYLTTQLRTVQSHLYSLVDNVLWLTTMTFVR